MAYEKHIVDTPNPYIKCLIELSYDQLQSNKAYFSYAIHFYRTNNHNKSYTNTINYTTYLNGTILKNGSTKHTVSGYSGSGKYTYDQLIFWEGKWVDRPDAVKETKLEFRFVSSGNVVEYNLDKTFTLTIPSYSSQVGKSKVESVKDLGNNSFEVKVKLGENGKDGHNKTTSAHIYYTNDNSPANKTSSYYSLWTTYGTSIGYPMGNGSAGETLTQIIPLEKELLRNSYKIRVRPYSIASKVNEGGIWENVVNTEGDIYKTSDGKDYITVYAYKPPTWNRNSISLTYDTTRVVADSTFILTYPAAVASNSNSPVKGYQFKVFYKAPGENTYSEVYSDVRGPDQDLSGNYRKIYFNYYTVGKEFQKGGAIKVSLQPFTNWGNGTRYYGEEYMSNPLFFNSKGTVKLKIHNNKPFVDGQLYIFTTTGWKEAEGVYIRTATGWKESV